MDGKRDAEREEKGGGESEIKDLRRLAAVGFE